MRGTEFAVCLRLTIDQNADCFLNNIPLFPVVMLWCIKLFSGWFNLCFLCRCFFIRSIALWLEKIDAVKLTLAWRKWVAFSHAERSAVFYQSGGDVNFPCGPKPTFLYWCTTWCIRAFCRQHLKNSYVCNLICLFVVDELQSCIFV